MIRSPSWTSPRTPCKITARLCDGIIRHTRKTKLNIFNLSSFLWMFVWRSTVFWSGKLIEIKCVFFSLKKTPPFTLPAWMNWTTMRNDILFLVKQTKRIEMPVDAQCVLCSYVSFRYTTANNKQVAQTNPMGVMYVFNPISVLECLNTNKSFDSCEYPRIFCLFIRLFSRVSVLCFIGNT